MKILRVLTLSVIVTFGLAACNQNQEPGETIDVQDEQPATDQTTTEDEGSNIGIDVKADEDGNVEGELEGDIKLEDRK